MESALNEQINNVNNFEIVILETITRVFNLFKIQILVLFYSLKREY